MNPIEHFAVVDLEATCDDHGRLSRKEMEIIEVGALMVRRDGFVTVSEFQSFVRPQRHPIVTEFCTQLTSIRQDQVAQAPTFVEMVPLLASWLESFPAVVFCSWGDYDRRQFQQDCSYHQIANPMPSRHLNLKRLFSKVQRSYKRFHVSAALAHKELSFEGTAHRGIDDARNIARLLPHCLNDSILAAT